MQNLTTIERQVTVKATPERVFSYVCAPEKWPQWATFVKQASSDGQGNAHWVYTMGGMKVESDTETTDVIQNRVYAFRQTKGFLREGSFRVEIEPSSNNPGGCVLNWTMRYEPPYSYLGKMLDKLGIGERAERDVDSSLDGLKKLVES